MADVSKTVAIVFEGKDETGAAIAGVDAGLKRVQASSLEGQARLQALSGGLKTAGDEAGKAGDKLRVTSDETDTFNKRVGGAAASSNLLATAFLAIVSAGLGKAFIDANNDLERFERAMTALRGSTEASSKELVYIREVSSRLGLDVRTAADAYVQLTAATKGTSLEGEQSRRIFEAISGAMSLLGKSSADTSGALLAINQIVSKGTVSMEELRGQIGERLPGAFAIAAKSMNLTTQELDALVSSGNLTATEFLPKFAAGLEEAFGKVDTVDTFSAAVARLRNTLDELFQAVGKSGVMDALATAVGGVTKLTEAGASTFDYFGTAVSSALNVLRGGSVDTFAIAMGLAEQRVAGVSAKLELDLNQNLAETNRLLSQNADAAATLSIDPEAAKFIRQMNERAQSVKDVAAAFDVLGIKREKVKKDIAEIIAAFETLANDPSIKGNEILAGFEASLKRVTSTESLNRLGAALTKAFSEGKLSAEEFDRAVVLLVKTQDNLRKGTDQSSEALKKQAAAAEKAKERAENFRLEMEKLASNERIKNIEARVTLDVANIQEQTKRVQAAFESLDNTVNSTADQLSDLFKLFASDNLSFTALSDIRDQIDLENKRRDEALRLQAELTNAQIEQIRAQTKLMNRGDSLIKIDGAGLQPHLEAFMWEILRAIQVRVNSQGLSLLLGT